MPRATTSIVFRCVVSLGCFFLACWFGAGKSLAATKSSQPQPLHERIDALIESEFAGPLMPPAGDLEFFRRLHLDLIGRIPSADEARAFLADSAPDKRVRAVDRLLASREHARQFATFLDVMLMERRAQKNVDLGAWQQFLFESAVTNKPFHRLAGEILAADGADERTRAAARFNLDREGDAALLTRDTGRIFFGMDLGCAQCHDDPRHEDYLQRDYHGLFAFFNRTYLFTRDSDKKAFLAEKHDGDVTFASVFTKESGATRPRLPGGAQVSDATLPFGDEYAVRPNPNDKNLRPVVKYSRRAELAKAVAETSNRAFNRNIANRLWGLMLGRPLVAPVDEVNSQNPAAYPALLDLLAAEFATSGYDMRAFLRELALTRAYQRGFELPVAIQSPRGLAPGWVKVLEGQRAQQTNAIAACESERKTVVDKIAAQRKALEPLNAELGKTNAVLVEVRKAGEPALVAFEAAGRLLATRRSALKSVEEAQAKLAESLVALPGDKELGATTDKLKARVTELNKEIEAAAKDVPVKEAAARPAREKLAAADASAKAIREKWQAEDAKLVALDRELTAALTRLQDTKTAARHTEQQLEVARGLVVCDTLRDEVATTKKTLASLQERLAHNRRSEEPDSHLKALEAKLAADTKKLAEAREKLTAVLDKAFAVGGFTGLTPEQFGWSVMRATGVLRAHELAAEAEFDKKNPPTDANRADPARLAERAQFVEQQVWDKLKGSAAVFVSFFGAGAGEPQDVFFATADQALYMNNGGTIRSWLAPGGGNLGDRLVKLTEPRALAEELYLTVLTRLPTDAEAAAVEQQLAARPKEKAVVVQDLAWALIASVEFRFRH